MSRYILLLALVLAVGGCSSHSDGPGVASAASANATPSPTASLSDTDRQRQWAQCMRDHGIDVQDPDPKGGVGAVLQGTDKAQANQAMQACESLLPGGSLDKSLTQEDLDHLRQFAQCLRDQGLDVSDPDPTTGGIDMGADGMSKTDPRLQQAISACSGRLRGTGGKSGDAS